MARNLELKARLTDLSRTRRKAAEISGNVVERLTQCDTYFPVRSGRLKLREFEDSSSELIWYEREERSGDRISRYERSITSDLPAFQYILRDSLEIGTVVEKTREVYLWNNCRIHLDHVEGIGGFIEFEVMLDQASDDGTERLNFLIERFEIKDSEVISGSYADIS